MVKIELFPETTFTTNTTNSNSNSIKNPEISTNSSTEDHLLTYLLAHKQDFSTITVADPVSLDWLIKENFDSQATAAVLPKRETLGVEFTDEDYENLCKKLRFQNDQFKKHQIRDISSKVFRLKSTFARLTTEEIFTALKNFDCNEDEATMLLTKTEFIAQLRNEIALMRQKKPHLTNQIFGSELVDDKMCVNSELVVVEPKSFEDEAADSQEEGGGEDEDDDEEDEEDEEEEYDEEKEDGITFDPAIQNKRKKQVVTSSVTKKVSRLKLDDAVANAAGMEGWSEARIRAYQSMENKPNTYFYRFNAPGETQKNGPWSREEGELFMNRLNEVGADGQWGIFSMSIPGRVGYQCSNYYRKLIEIGRIKDSNYRLDDKGKAHYIGGKTRATSSHKLNESESEDSSESDSDEPLKLKMYSSPANSPRGTFYENPLPNFIDAITQTEVIRPAISPYGHVLSYDTWLKCLLNGDRKNTCPLTNQPLHKRQLIFLTVENVEMYRDRIRRDK